MLCIGICILLPTCLCNKYFLSTYCVPGTSLSPGDIAIKEQSLDLPEAYYLSVRETDKVAIVISALMKAKQD